MPSLNWIGKEKIVNHDKDVPFRLLRKNKKYSLGESENLILEGDNLEALKALIYLHPRGDSKKGSLFLLLIIKPIPANVIVIVQPLIKKELLARRLITD